MPPDKRQLITNQGEVVWQRTCFDRHRRPRGQWQSKEPLEGLMSDQNRSYTGPIAILSGALVVALGMGAFLWVRSNHLTDDIAMLKFFFFKQKTAYEI